MTLTESQKKVAEYESFYAGTQYYASPSQPFGAPVTQEQFKTTPEGEKIPIWATGTEIMTEYGPVTMTEKAFEKEKKRYEEVGLPIPRPYGEGEYVVLTSQREEVTAPKLSPFEASAKNLVYNPYTQQYIQQQRQFLKTAIEPTYILPPYPTGQKTSEVARGTLPLAIRTKMDGFDIEENIPMEMPTRKLEVGEYAFTGKEPTIFSEWKSRIIEFFGYGTEPLPKFMTEGPSLETTGKAEYVLLPKKQYGQQTLTLTDFIGKEKLPRYEFGQTEIASGFALGILTAPIEIVSMPAQLLGYPTEITTKYPLSPEFMGAFTTGTYIGMELTTVGAQKIAKWIKTKIPPKEYITEAPIGMIQKREIYARQFPKALDLEKQTEIVTATFISEKKPILYIPEQFEFKFIKGKTTLPVYIEAIGLPRASIFGEIEYGRAMWDFKKGLSLETVMKGIKQEPILTLRSDAVAISHLRNIKAAGMTNYLTGEIFLLGEYKGKFDLTGRALTREITLRHELIHWTQPTWTEEEVIAATWKGKGLPEVKEILWPYGYAAKEEIFIADLTKGVQPHIELSEFDLGKYNILKPSGKIKPIGQVVQEIYGTKQTIQTIKSAGTQPKFSIISLGGIELKPTITARWPAYVEAGEKIQFITTPPTFKTEKLGVQTLGYNIVRGQKLAPSLQFESSQKRVSVSKMAVAQIPKRRIEQQLQTESIQRQPQLFKTILGQEQKQQLLSRSMMGLKQQQLLKGTQITTTPFIKIPKLPRTPPPSMKKPALLKILKRESLIKRLFIEKKRKKVLPLADILSVNITAGRLFKAGKKPLPLHPRSEKIIWGQFRKTAGLRIPTTQMLLLRKKSKRKKWL